MIRGPRVSGALFFSPLAGPIEFSTGELVLLLVVMVAVVLFLPAAAGLVGVLRYRSRTPETERSRREATFVFLRWAGAAILIGFVISAITEFLN